ncbi:odorant receptor Or2-like [Osmia bicornis bicornis]|uniref:odorant receptor Or2-like n=1 Tax=Osmia bicornis bicornis TaxID=1437191 RepID=UPI001EAF40E5|nr:odorant receptor Or2-like [Osmia bicornis bicornis]
MGKEVYTDLSIISSKIFLRIAGAWIAMNSAEEFRRKISLLNVAIVATYSLSVNTMNIHYFWGNDISYCVYCFCNILCVTLALSKVTVLRIRRFELADVVAYAEKHFWHYNYDAQEQLYFAQCQGLCKFLIYFVFIIPVFVLFSYVVTPILSNVGLNKSERLLIFEVRSSWPLRETPYYEILFTWQAIVVFVLFVAYICPDVFLCVLNIHVICQFRIVQYKMLHFWNSDVKDTDTVRYSAQCSVALKKCIQQHQSLIEFCEKLEHVFSYTVLFHMVIFSLLMGFDCYEIILSDASTSRRLLFVFHVLGSFIHLMIFTYTCHGLMEESTNIITTIYFGSWNTLPMDKIGRSLRSDVKMIMTRSLKPCRLTAGGFFPVSLETFTGLASSTFSYFTLLRESFMRNEG